MHGSRAPLMFGSAVALLACGGAPAAPATASPILANEPAPTLLFATTVPIDEEGNGRLYVVLDETRGGAGMSIGEPAELANDGVVAASVRPIDATMLDPSTRALASSRFVALGAECAGALGEVVELTLRGVSADDPDYRVTVLAAPLEPACDQDAYAVHVEGAPPARVYARSEDLELDEETRAGLLAAIRALPEHAAVQAEIERDYEERLERPWDEEVGDGLGARVLRDAGGHELVYVRVGGNERSLDAIFERVGDAWELRAVEAGSQVVIDLEDDGTIETVDRLGLLRMRARARSFVRGPYVPGC